MKVNKHEFNIGKIVELEHTNDEKIAQKIALDHLKENPIYYSKLLKAGLIDEKKALDYYNQNKNYFDKNLNEITSMKITKSQLRELISEQIKLIKEAEVPADLKKDLTDFCRKVWDGDVSPEEIYNPKERLEMKKAMNFYNKNKNVLFKNGIPFPGDDEDYDKALKTDKGAQYLQKLIKMND